MSIPLPLVSVSWDTSDMLQKYAKIRSAIPAILASPVVLPAAAGVLVVALLSLRRGRQPWLEVDHACLHSFFVLEERTFEWQCFRVQSEHNQHLIRTAKLVNDTFRQLFSGVALALWWCMDSSILATTTASFVATLPGLSSCLPFFLSAWKHNHSAQPVLVLQGFVEVSIRAGSFSVAMEIDKLLGREDRRQHMRHTHTQCTKNEKNNCAHTWLLWGCLHSIPWEWMCI